MASMSWIIVELTGDIRKILTELVQNQPTRGRSCPSQLGTQQVVRGYCVEDVNGARFPWIQRSDPDDTHSLKILPLKNQPAVLL